MRFIAPAGTPLGMVDLVAGLSAGLLGQTTANDLSSLLAQHAGHPHCWLITSGRAGMTLLLRAAASLDATRTEVIIAGYTCYSVAASVELAGLTPRLCDIDPHTLSFDMEQLRQMDFGPVLAIVSANLYGIPNALDDIEQLAREKGVLMIDDAAQALGAQLSSRNVGGFGDAGIYSFDKGKNITTMQGGAIVAREGVLAQAMQAQFNVLPMASMADTLQLTIKLALYGALLHPILYGVIQRLPGLGLGITRYETEYPVTRLSSTLSGLALRLARRLQSINATRISNARRLRDAISDVKGIRLAAELPTAVSVFPRLPIFVADPQRRSELIAKLNHAGIGATTSYPLALVDVPEVRRRMTSTTASQRGAQTIANSIVTLPTHAYSTKDLPQRVRTIIDSTQ